MLIIHAINCREDGFILQGYMLSQSILIMISYMNPLRLNSVHLVRVGVCGLTVKGRGPDP